MRWKKQAFAKAKGHAAERVARRYLEQQGLRWLVSNYQCRMGEIDLIMTTPNDTLVFIEVRLRTNLSRGSGAESVTYHKQQKLLKTASYYLMTHPQTGLGGVRFDILSLDGPSEKITWIKQAFEEMV